MRITATSQSRQGVVFVCLALCAVLTSCGGWKKETSVIIPPATSPLSRDVIGFGVINVSYTHVAAGPEEGGASQGYLRRGSLVRVIERRTVKKAAVSESWVLIEGGSRGWLREKLVDIYDNEGRAKTAAESMSR
jgi:hypothetical protein